MRGLKCRREKTKTVFQIVIIPKHWHWGGLDEGYFLLFRQRVHQLRGVQCVSCTHNQGLGPRDLAYNYRVQD